MSKPDVVDETTVDASAGHGIAVEDALVRLVVEQIETGLRSFNDRVGELAPTWDGMHALVCECADPNCICTLTVPTGVFDELRAAPRRFLIAPGHERAGSEKLVLCADEYFIVSRPSAPPGDAVIRP
ncbi:MAG TPA: hypothetical protein VH210_12235 [Gaiellaceae bacterium]|jgi:hypothetical protein|nr:hypothetical protein [Gaiellaceae bacterium]